MSFQFLHGVPLGPQKARTPREEIPDTPLPLTYFSYYQD